MRAKLSLAVASVLVSVLAGGTGRRSLQKVRLPGQRLRQGRSDQRRQEAARQAYRRVGCAERHHRLSDRQEDRHLRALPGRHSLRRAHLHCAGQRLLGRWREAEQQRPSRPKLPARPTAKRRRTRSARPMAMGIAPQQAAAVRRLPTPTAAPAVAQPRPRRSSRSPLPRRRRLQRLPFTPTAAAPAATATVETGALQAGQGLPMPEKRAATDKDRAAAASAAASAAAAAERAAVAAETAANAAKEAAAAAVAASAASKGTATVPPLDHASGAKPAHNE